MREVKLYVAEKVLELKGLLIMGNAKGHVVDLLFDDVPTEYFPQNTLLVQPDEVHPCSR